jgi:hypothetical protein
MLELTSQKLPLGAGTKGLHLLYLFWTLIHKLGYLWEYGHYIEDRHRTQPRAPISGACLY